MPHTQPTAGLASTSVPSTEQQTYASVISKPESGHSPSVSHDSHLASPDPQRQSYTEDDDEQPPSAQTIHN